MKTICLKGRVVEIYNVDDFPYNIFKYSSTVERGKKKYIDILGTFDTETTSINEGDTHLGFMYVWQFCLEGYVVAGRTWKEYQTFTYKLTNALDLENRHLVVYVHNLSFEFQFMRNFFHVDKIFARSERDVIYCILDNAIEYRCSYKLTNMGLLKFTQKTPGVFFKKMDGEEFNYSIHRYPDTILTDKEWGYAVSDVLGLYEALKIKMKSDGDDLISIPMTSTGYARRVYRTHMQENMNIFGYMWNKRLDKQTYILCREACRGAISGSNHIYTEETLEDVDSEDIKSSYPFQMMTKLYPMSRFIKVSCKYGSSDFERYINDLCCIIVWECKNLKIKRWSAIPYISKAKCRAIYNHKTGNGKVYAAERIGMCCTEVDFKNIRKLYNFDSVTIHEMYVSERGLLPKPFREVLAEQFQTKTDLEDGDPFTYAKYKNVINASFGMMLTDILHEQVEYIPNSNEPWIRNDVTDIDMALSKYYRNKNSFLHYQHGVWILAHARDDLLKGMDIVGNDIVQVDTDSVKHIGDHREGFIKRNNEIIANAENFDVKPYSIKNGKKHYLGVWEHEGKNEIVTYKKFRSLGAKKYAYDEGDGKIHITVAGLNKASGGEYIQKIGGIDKFTIGIRIPETYSGRTVSYYNDLTEIKDEIIEGHRVVYSSNICVENTTYTLGVASEWLDMILKGVIDAKEVMEFDGAFKNYV